MNERRYAVAVDGPSGAGKSTLAKAAAERLGILYVDTGAIYRTIGLYVQRRGIDPQDTSAVLAALPDIHIAMEHDGDGLQRMLLRMCRRTSACRRYPCTPPPSPPSRVCGTS